MKPEHFYSPDEHPSSAARRRMWREIASGVSSRRSVFSIRDPRSFAAGMAAAILLLLAGNGLYDLAHRFYEQRRPQEVRFDEAYRSAIREFESVIPSPVKTASGGSSRADLLHSRIRQLELVDSAITELRSDIARTDLSPLKRSRLKQLYAMKLQVLQEIIQQGDIEL